MHPPAPTSEEFKAAMASFAAGVTIVATKDASGLACALTATAFSSVSLDPPLCLVCIDRHARTHQPLLVTRYFAVSILSEAQQMLAARFAKPISDKFDSVAWSGGALTGLPVIEGALACMECKVVEVHSGGDHDIFIARVLSVTVRDGAPLLYWRGNYAALPALSAGAAELRKAGGVR